MQAELEQKLVDARYMRDWVVTRPRCDGLIAFSYRVVAAQGVVDQARKELYIYLRQNGSEIKHRDL